MVAGVGISIDELVRHYPSLYHTAEVSAFESIERFGLLSTTAILDLVRYGATERKKIEDQPRRQSVALEYDDGGQFVIRDQRPLSASKLAGCLQDGITVEEWCRLLNRKVYFWVDKRRVTTLLSAAPYKDREHLVFEVDTRSLVEAHKSDVTLAAMNTGSTNPIAHKRGKSTICSLDSFPYQDRLKRRLPVAVELCIDYSVPSIFDHVIAVWRASADKDWSPYDPN